LARRSTSMSMCSALNTVRWRYTCQYMRRRATMNFSME